MKSQKNILGLGAALSLATVGLTFSGSALAQEDAPAQDEVPAAEADSAVEATAETTEGEAPAEAAVQGPAGPTEEELRAQLKAELKAELLTELKADVPPPVETAPVDPKAERDDAVALIGLEMLPGSAYPEGQTRGITNGSLWRTFHGQQWPYMPLMADKPGIRIGFSGYLWNDLSNTHITVDESLNQGAIYDQTRWNTQTRGMFRVTPTYNAGNGWFAQGNAELVVHGDMRPDTTGVLPTTEDLFIRVGKWDLFDVQVGRFQGWEVANHYGMALDQNTLERAGAWIISSSLKKPTDGYGLTYFWDRQDYTLGAYALHLYPTKYLRGELLGHVGVGNSQNAATPYQLDIRPVGIFDIGWLKLKAGYEYGKATPQDSEQKVRETKNGYGFAAQFVFEPYVEFGGSFGRGFQDVLDKDEEPDLAASNTVQTVGGFVNVSPGHEPLVFGFGAFLNSWEDLRVDNAAGPHQGKVDTNDQFQIYGSAQYTLWTRLNLKFVLSHANNKVEHYSAGTYSNNALSARFRTELLF
jgi:hypothetical protein